MVSIIKKGKRMNENQDERCVMPIRFDGKCPVYANAFAAGLDLHVANPEALVFETGDHATVQTGVRMALPRGHFGLIAIRSGLGMKGLVLSNGVGIIDEDYRGEIRIPLYYHGSGTLRVEPGERVAQMVVIPYVQPVLQPCDALDETERGSEGFGSSGRF